MEDILTKEAILSRYEKAKNLRGVNLKKARLKRICLDNADLGGSNLEKANLREASLKGAVLKGVTARRVDLRKAQIKGADLSEGKFDGAVMSRADLSNSNLQSISLEGADLSKVDFTGANLTGANLTGANVEKAIFKGAVCSSANFSGVDMQSADLEGVVFEGAILHKTLLGEIVLSQVNLKNADLKGADLSFTEAEGADFRGANLKDANLEYSNLTNADMNETNLSGANMRFTVLQGTRLEGATLDEADFRKAKPLSEEMKTRITEAGGKLSRELVSKTVKWYWGKMKSGWMARAATLIAILAVAIPSYFYLTNPWNWSVRRIERAANESVELQQLEKALHLYEILLQKSTNQREQVLFSLQSIGRINYELDQLDEAETAYRKILADNSADQWTTWGAEKGILEILFSRGRIDEVLKIHADLAEKYSKVPQMLVMVYESMTDVQMRTGHLKEALATCIEGIGKVSDSPNDQARLLLYRGDIHKDMGRHDIAKSDYWKVLDLTPSDNMILMEAESRLAELAAKSGKIDEASDIYDDLIKRHSDDPQSIMSLCMNKINLYSQNNRHKEAVQAVEEFITLVGDRGDLKAQLLMCKAQIKMEEGAFDEAGAVYRKVLGIKSAEQWTVRDAERGMAEIAFAKGLFDDAMGIYKKLIKKYSKNPNMVADLYCGMTDAQMRAGHLKEALVTCNEGIARVGDRPDYLARLSFRLGTIYMDTNRADKAAEEYKKV
ncbi:pentapeptide repeat-containing protein, partial [Thermodesulfobacteriota bacterium]